MRFIKPSRPIREVYLHCSASDNPKHDNVATMDKWHRQRGFNGCGYNFFIRKDGTIEIGRDIELTPAAQRGHNRYAIAICLHGLSKSKFTKAQFAALADLCAQIDRVYASTVRFRGHCEVSAKSCPVFDYKKVLKLQSGGKFPTGEFVPSDDYTIDEMEFPETGNVVSKLGSKTLAVEILQRRLVALGYHVGIVDGHFGKRTRAAVLAFQADNYLITDGIVGPATNEAFSDAEAREIGGNRSKASVASLAEGGSRIADASIKGGSTGIAVSAVGIVGVVGQFSDSFQTIKAQVEPIAQPFGGLTEIMVVGLLVVVGFMTWQLIRSGRARAEDHRSGKTH